MIRKAIWQFFLPKKKIEINDMIFQVGKTYKLKFGLDEETQLIGKAKVISIDDGIVHWKGVGNLKGCSGGFKEGIDIFPTVDLDIDIEYIHDINED